MSNVPETSLLDFFQRLITRIFRILNNISLSFLCTITKAIVIDKYVSPKAYLSVLWAEVFLDSRRFDICPKEPVRK